MGRGSHPLPPGLDGVHGERGGVVVDPDRYPAGVVGDVVDAVGVDLAEVFVGEVVDVDPFRLAGPVPFPTGVLERSDEFFLLRVDADHRVPADLMGRCRVGQVVELGIPVRVLAPVEDLGVGL